jgi:xanthine dehydrogenase accessory factor
VKLALLEELRAARAAGRAVVLATWLDGSEQALWDAAEGGAPAPGDLAEAVAGVVRRDAAEVVEIAGAAVLLEPHLPPLRMILVGAVHIAQPLSAMAALAGFAVTIVDPRRSWATDVRFPGQALVTEWPDSALEALRPDARTAVVTLSHDPKLDDPGLAAALRSPAFYVGCLGSQKTHAARLVRLGGQGFDEAALGRLRGPVGLRIGARSPAEIAVSILAEIIATLRGAAETARGAR